MFIQMMRGGIMASPFSLDLRQRILQACERRIGSHRQIAELFGVSQGFVEKLLGQVRRTGRVAAYKQGRGPASRITTDVLEQIRQRVLRQPDITRVELSEQLAQAGIVQISVTTVGRALHALGLTRKKSRYMPANVTRPRSVRHVKTTGRRSPGSIPSA